MKARTRRLASDIVHLVWRHAAEVGVIGPDDARGRRFQHMGKDSCIGFPPGVIFGEHLIRIGDGTLIGPDTTLTAGMYPEEPLKVPSGVVITIGRRCLIGRGNSIIGRCGIEIGDEVTTAPNVYITDHNHTYHDVTIPIGRQWPTEEPVRIGSGCWLGTGVVVLPGTQMGDHVAVAANSVVRGTIPDRCVIAGAPAKVVRRHTGAGWEPPLRTEVPTPDWWREPTNGP
jgi:acetyltransferase-like isoleucine patch superfamily enzyme